MNAEEFLASARSLGLDLTREQLERFEQFEIQLYAANEVMNLTRVPREECWLRHFVDSLLCHDQIPPGASVLDIGTGPGFPAWPLACVRPDIFVVALDGAGKMIRFLTDNPLPNLEPIRARAEEWRPGRLFDVVTGRAVAPLAIQLELSAPFCALGGTVLPMRSAQERASFPASIEPLGLRLEEVIQRTVPTTEIVRLMPRYRKVAETDPRFPRSWAEIRRKPLFPAT